MMDHDTRSVTEALDAAQARSSLDQASFARALGTSASRYSTYRTGKVAPTAAFLIRAKRIAASLAAANERSIPSSLSAAESIENALRTQGEDWAFSLVLEARDRLIDTIRHRPESTSAWEANARIDDQRWNTLFAAVVAHAFESTDAAPPRWTEGVPLDDEWLPVESIRYNPEQTKQRTPSWLAERNIFIAEHDLTTA